MPSPTDNQIEDIFSSVDKTPKNQNQGGNLLYTNSALETPAPIGTGTASSSKKILFAIGLVLIVAILCGVIYIMIKQFGFFQKTPVVTPVVPYPDQQEEVLVPQEQVPAEVPSEVPAINDADMDGLSLEEETTLQINPNKADTDSDGLSDYDEVKMFLTDPLNPDTDGDSFLDGAEVKAGYNPKGAGQLLNFNAALQELNNKKQ